jgi:serine protease Do
MNMKRRNIMKYETPFKTLTVFTALALFVFFSAAPGVAQTQAPGKPGTASASSVSPLQELFHKARESFVKKDLRDAASEIRQAAAFLGGEEAKATGEAKKELPKSAQELLMLAERVENKTVKSEKELDDSFANAETALARYYHAMASESWAKKEISSAGQYLMQAADHVEKALTSAGEKIGETSKRVIREAKEVAWKLEKGVGLSAAEVGQSLDTIGKEITERAHKMPLSGSADTGSLQITGKPAGTVDLSTAIMNVAKQNMPKVVYIEVTESKVVQNPFSQFDGNPLLKRFFGIPKMPRKFRQEVQGLGSGMIIDALGHILTNNHVAGGATKIQVTLADGNRYPATLVGADPKTDLAVVKISAKEPLTSVAFGDSDKIEVGEWVVAIGAPRALEKTVTQGIISAKHRTGITDPNTYQDFLQTDAAINPGNSGGPLLNIYGQVIGINAAIASASGGSEGIGFTIPSRMVVYIANALIAHGKVERGWLGVSIRDLTPGLAKTAHVENMAGALIVDVAKGGPADKAGLKKDDVVIAYEGKDIKDSATLRNNVAQTPVGRQANLTIMREGKKENVTVTIGNLEEAAKFQAAAVKERLGAEVRVPTPAEIDKYGLNENQGVVISWLDPKGPLAVAGFEVDDVILAINEQPVEGTDSFITLVSALPSGQRASFAALDHRTGNTGSIFVAVR